MQVINLWIVNYCFFNYGVYGMKKLFAVHNIMSLYCELETKIHINVMSYALYSYSF